MSLLKKEKQKERTHLLILGLPRSGTSILASLVGAHSSISLISEDFGRSWLDSLGKPVVANKLCVPRQIDMTRSRSFIIKLMNRFGLLKLWPKSSFSIEDYLGIENLKIILITRPSSDVRNSMKRRGAINWVKLNGKTASRKVTAKDIKFTLDKGTRILSDLDQLDNSYTVSFENLINETEKTLKNITQFIGIPFEKQMIEKGTEWNWMYANVSASGIDKSKA